MKFENIVVFNLEGALRGMRNPLNSWAKSDSHYCLPNECVTCKYCDYQDAKNDLYNWEACAKYVDWTPYRIGENDMNLAQRLIKGGPVHAKFMRQIFVSVDITAPLYWWKEMDTYKVGTVANSTSTMHKLASTPITIDCFEIDDYSGELEVVPMTGGLSEDGETYNACFGYDINDIWESFIEDLEKLRQLYNKTKDIRYWKELVRLLPESWLQKRTWTANYEVLRNIYHWRRTHKLSEWQKFCTEFIKTLPYAKELILFNNTPET